MTRNQIEYSKHLETQRANLANEAIARQNANSRLLEIEESQRHNKVSEDQGWAEQHTKSRQASASETTAQANWRTALANEQNAQTRIYEAYSGRLQAQAALSQAASAQQNAQSNLINALAYQYLTREQVLARLQELGILQGQLEVAQGNLEVSQGKLEVEQGKLDVEQQRADYYGQQVQAEVGLKEAQAGLTQEQTVNQQIVNKYAEQQQRQTIKLQKAQTLSNYGKGYEDIVDAAGKAVNNVRNWTK